MNRDDEPYSDAETERRMNDALRRALTTPHKPQATVRHPRQKREAPTGAGRARRKPRGGAGA
jgi:hypothetical protein